MEIFKQYPKNKRIYIDIETVSVVPELDGNLNPELFDSWEYKARYMEQRHDYEDLYTYFKDKAPLYPEFGKIICISVGVFSSKKGSEGEFVVKSFYGEDEKEMLKGFNKMLNTLAGTQKRDANGTMDTGRGIDILTGFSIKGFDIPYIVRRMFINGLKPHSLMDYSLKKPWETKVLDLKDVWQSTSWYASSLINVTTALGLPSPKDVIQGSEVSSTYWGAFSAAAEESDKEKATAILYEMFDKIKVYCEKDVVAVMQSIEKLENLQ